MPLLNSLSSVLPVSHCSLAQNTKARVMAARPPHELPNAPGRVGLTYSEVIAQYDYAGLCQV